MADYHMIKYIEENSEALRRTLDNNETLVQNIVERIKLNQIQRLVVVGIGSSYTAAMIAAPAFQYYSSLPTFVLPSTELGHYATRLVDQHTMVIVVSRSGERGWVIDVLKDSIARGAFGVAVTGVADSLMAESAQMTLITGEGPEITFPKTKSVIACAGILLRLALALAKPDDNEAARLLTALRASPDAIKNTVESIKLPIQALMPFVQTHENVIVCGTGSNYGAALEGALKIQETAFIATHCDDTGNLLHGSLGGLNKNWLVVPLVTAYDYKLSKDLLQLVRNLGANSLSIVEPGLNLKGLSDHVLTLPERIDPFLTGLVFLPPMQLMTYYWAVALNLDPDSPSIMRTVLDAILPPGREEPELREE